MFLPVQDTYLRDYITSFPFERNGQYKVFTTTTSTNLTTNTTSTH